MSARLLAPTQASSGCLSCRSYHDTKNDDSFILIEEWKSEEDLGKHKRSDEFKVILALMDLSTGPPEFKIHTLSHTTGMDAVVKMRSRK